LTRLFHNFLAEIFAKIFTKTKVEAKIFAKTKIEAKIFAKTKLSTNTYAKILLFGIFIFLPDFFKIFWQKFSRKFSRKRKVLRKLSRKRKFSRNEISRKLPHFRMIFAFRENEKNRFRFNPIQNSHIPSFLYTVGIICT
jgi:hypothetical protein